MAIREEELSFPIFYWIFDLQLEIKVLFYIIPHYSVHKKQSPFYAIVRNKN